MMRTSRPLENAAMYQELSKEQALPGPISLSVDIARPLKLPPLEWQHWNNSGQLKITNTGYTTVIAGHWRGNRPSVFGGPFTSAFSFAQIHFHWGADHTQGSEHAIEDKRYPLEMHVLLYKSSYERSKVALKERDGLAVLAYFFQLSDEPNKNLEPIVDGVARVQEAKKQAPVSPSAISIVEKFIDQYFLYWAGVETEHCSHTLSWIVFPQALNISSSQLEIFRKTLGPERKPIMKNFCDLQPHMGRNIFFATMDADAEDAAPMNQNPVAYPQLLDIFPRREYKAKYCCLSAREKKLNECIDLPEIIEEIEMNMTVTRYKITELEELYAEFSLYLNDQNFKWNREIDIRIGQIEKSAGVPQRSRCDEKEEAATRMKLLCKKSSSEPNLPILHRKITVRRHHRHWNWN